MIRTLSGRKALVGVLLLLPASPALATTITVNRFDEVIDWNDGLCSLGEAVISVNNQNGIGGCPAGDGNDDRILLPAGTYKLFGGLRLERSMSLEGAGIGRTVIESASFTTIDVRGWARDVSANVTNMTLKGIQSITGGLKCDGSSNPAYLYISNVRLTGFTLNALWNYGGYVYVDSSTIDGNSHEFYGGAIGNDGFTSWGGGYMEVYNSLIANNSALTNSSNFKGAGGALYNRGWASFVNCTFSGNRATDKGGAILVEPAFWEGSGTSHLQLWFTTVAFNKAGNRGGGVFVDGAAGITANTGNSIVAKNTASRNPDFSGRTGSNQHGAPNLFGSKTGATQLKASDLSGDPKLGALANNGGPTRTHALLAGSPAIDRAAPDEEFTWDQRIFARPVDGDRNGTAIPDIGAFEKQ